MRDRPHGRRDRIERLRSVLGEASGAFGDLGVFLPYVVAAIAGGVFAATPVFLGFAAGYLLVAAVYRLPIAVQPMKALGAIVIAGGLTSAEAAWAGALIGATLLLLAATPTLTRAARAIPQSVVTGLQVGLGLMLGAAAIEMMAAGWPIALAALLVLGLALVWRRGPWALAVVIAGALFAPGLGGDPTSASGAADGLRGVGAVVSAVTAQLPLTLLNAVVVAAAVARSLYPHAPERVSERRLAATSGLLNLVAAPFGALPMCHGAGGVAAHHRFGASGVGAPLILAILCGAAALAGPALLDALVAIPTPAVGALLAYAAVDLAFSKRVFDARPDCRPVIAAAAAATFFGGALLGLVAGLAAELLRVQIRRRARANGSRAG